MGCRLFGNEENQNSLSKTQDQSRRLIVNVQEGETMTKHFLLVLIMLSLSVSCGKGGSSGSGSSEQTADSQTSTADIVEGDDVANGASTEQDEPKGSAITATSSLPAKALSFKTNVNLMGFTSAQATKYNRAVALVKKVIRTEAFRTKILNFRYNGSKQFANNNGKTNSQIYQAILDAAEKLKPTKNNTMDLGVKLYYANNSVVGYTNPSITYINVNRKFFNQYADNQVAGNLFHEWLHKLGYGHDSSSTSRRPYSVPYAVGYMIRDLGKKFL